ALQNVSPSQLADRDLFDFEVLDSQRELDFKDPEELKKRLDVVNLSFAAE
ncbi:tRNA 2-thiocytidine(32) synthetase TtcA, partial [Acinetobacter baumannii]